MNEYTNPYQDNYAEGSERNILETAWGRKFVKKIELGYEAILEKIVDEELFKE